MPGDRRLRSVLRRVRAGSLLLALVAIGDTPAAAEPIPQPQLLPVPFLPQTEALCGGAAAAMLFRYHGDRHADVQQFASLVDRARGGIPADRLVDAMAARGWTTTQTAGTRERIREQLAQAQPVMLLVEDRPARYHFIVAVGADAEHVYVHDPTWGPGRPIPWPALARGWQAAGHWMLTIARDPARPVPAPSSAGHAAAAAGRPPSDPACDRAVDAAVAAVQAQGLDSADRLLGAVRAACPQSSRPTSELAGVRFAQRRYAAAADLAQAAATLDAHDAYAWEVLASSRFVQNDVAGALAAWNAIGRPQLDIVRIEGLSSLRYAFLAAFLPLRSGATITPGAFALAERRLRELPGLTRTQLRLNPGDDGWSEVTAAVAEHSPWPHDTPAWLGRAAHAAIGRDVTVDVPGWTGHGELWTASWRWWEDRPRIAFGLAMPSAGTLRGVWHVTASWSAQAFATSAGSPPERETQRHAGIALSDWLRPNLRYTLQAGLDAWQRPESPARSRTITAGFALDRRWARDRLSTIAEGQTWWPIGPRRGTSVTDDGSRFQSLQLRVTARSRVRERGFVTIATAAAQAVSTRTPRLLWPGAGDVFATSPWLRAHPLTTGGIVNGAAFGRQLVAGSIEQRRWFDAGPLMQVAVAGFVDAARATRRADGTARGPLVVDAGVGLRIRVAGQNDLLRVDYGHGLRDGANVIRVGWAR